MKRRKATKTDEMSIASRTSRSIRATQKSSQRGSVMTDTTSITEKSSKSASSNMGGGARSMRSADGRSMRSQKDSMSRSESMKPRMDRERGKMQEMMLQVAAAERALNEVTSTIRQLDSKFAHDEGLLDAENSRAEAELKALKETEATLDRRVSKQQTEMEALRDAVDHMKLKFVYAFLTKDYSLGFDVDPAIIFEGISTGIQHGSASLDWNDWGAQRGRRFSPAEKPPNIVTPYLIQTREELESVLAEAAATPAAMKPRGRPLAQIVMTDVQKTLASSVTNMFQRAVTDPFGNVKRPRNVGTGPRQQQAAADADGPSSPSEQADQPHFTPEPPHDPPPAQVASQGGEN